MHLLAVTAMLVAASILASPPAVAQEWCERGWLTAPDSGVEDRFGASVAIAGDTAFIGTRGDDDRASNAGAVYVYGRAGSAWLLAAKLFASDPDRGDGFGYVVAMDDDTAVIGAPWDDGVEANAGAVYVMRRTDGAWTEEAKLTASDAPRSALFGISVALAGDRLVVGAIYDRSAYVFDRVDGAWVEQAKLLSGSDDESDDFGWSVSVSGDTAVVGAIGDEEGCLGGSGCEAGAAYVFRRDSEGWSVETKLTPVDVPGQTWFGYAVSIEGETLLIGAPLDDEVDDKAGAAHVYRRTDGTWIEEAKLRTSDDAAGDRLGEDVSLRAGRALVGTRVETAYVFRDDEGQWTEQARLVPIGGPPRNGFGMAVAIDDERAVIGAPGDDEGGLNAGAAYMLRATGDEWATQARLVAPRTAVSDRLGWWVEIEGDSLVAGAPGDGDAGAGAGAAFVFRRGEDGTWADEAKLRAGDGAEDDSFGACLALDGDAVLVGADDHAELGPYAGAAYVFRRVGADWSQEAKLLAPDGERSDGFGSAVGLRGDVAVVSAPGDDDAGDRAGSVHVFRRAGETWEHEAKLLALDADVEEGFGRSLAVGGDIFVVGADQADGRREETGAAYVFRRAGDVWTQEAKLFADDGVPGDDFGRAVSISEGEVVVGAPRTGGAALLGKVYAFRWTGDEWIQRDRILRATQRAGDQFGDTVSVHGEWLVVGVSNNDDDGDRAGVAHVFRLVDGTWAHERTLRAPDPEEGDRFGSSVATDGELAAIGAPYDDDEGESSGSLSLFEIEACRCPGDVDENGRVNFDDMVAVLSAWGDAGGPADIDRSGRVDFDDLLIVLDAWGTCE